MKILVPATSANLGPGFDCLGLSIKLYNEIQISPQNFTQISINGEGSENFNLKKNNTFIQIFNQITAELTGKSQNFRFSFTNNIPFSRGLGSSSSVIVGAIAAAFEICGFGINRTKILNKALEFENHPDNISPCVWGGFCVNIVHNNAVLTQKFEISSEIKAVIAIPQVAISTAHSRTLLPKSYSQKDAISNVAHAAFLSACFMKKDYKNLRAACVDKMHEEVRMAGLKELFLVRKIAYENGALLSCLSGSGSSFLNLAHKDDASRLCEILRQNFREFRVEIFDLDNDGFVIFKG